MTTATATSREALAVAVDGVTATYGPATALDGVDVQVPAGSTVAVLGHNGAGKTTLIRVMTTAIRPNRGQVRVDGVDAVARPLEVRRRIGVTGQYAGLDPFLTAVENLELVGRLSGLRGAARGRARDLVARFGLDDVAGRRAGELSRGGPAGVSTWPASLVASPSVLFLDEPTTGLDPVARLALWEVVEGLTASGTSVVLTTQYLEEADRLADHVLVLDHGAVAAQGSPAELKSLIGGKVVKATVPAEAIARLSTAPQLVERLDDRWARATFKPGTAEAAGRLAGELADAGLTELAVSAPSLDDVFFHLATTGASR